MKNIAAAGLIFLAGQAFADILPQGGEVYKCQTTGSFFDFSPAGAIASCKEEIEEFCKAKNAPPIIGKVTGEPSGYGVYARAEIKFQCMSAEDRSQRQKLTAEARNQQMKIDVDNAKKTCLEVFGFKEGTPEFGSCLMEQQKQLFASRLAEKERAAQSDIADAQIAQQRRADSESAAVGAMQAIQQMTAPKTPTYTNCSSYGSNVSCTTR